MTTTATATQKQLKFINDLETKIRDNNINFDFKSNIETMKEAGIYINALLKACRALKTQKTSKSSSEEKTAQFKSISLIEDEVLKVETIALHYDNGIYKKWYFDKNDHMNKHITQEFKQHYVIKTTDNYLIDINIDKPSIKSDIYYDDETEAPAKSYENFELYNLRLQNTPLNDESIKNIENLAIYKFNAKYNNNNTYYLLRNRNYHYYYSDGELVRDLTEEEKADITKIYCEEKEAFIKRLKAYWKKYQDKIYCIGYWANR